MKAENKFYVLRKENSYLYPNYRYDLETGEISYTSSLGYSVIIKHNCSNCRRIIINTPVVLRQYGIRALTWDEKDNYLGYVVINNHNYYDFEYVLPEKAYQVAFAFLGTVNIKSPINVKEYFGFLVNPHYKEIKKKYKKENNQLFFRESLEGKINLFGKDYQIVKNASLEDALYFYIYRNDSILIKASFNKSDCVFNDTKKSVELKLSYSDKYSKILDKYDNTYDIIKLAPQISPIMLTKRCIIQIYVQGANVVSSYASGSYWETEVSERVDDENLLLNKYFFAKGPRYAEVNINNSPYRITNSDIWNAEYGTGSIVFRKVYNSGQRLSGIGESSVHLISNDVQGGTYSDDHGTTIIGLYDIYTIEIWSGINGTGTKLYQSELLYAKDVEFNNAIAIGADKYKMNALIELPMMTFYLSNFVTENQIWGRVICDVDSIPDGQGGYIQTYNIPYDDFAVQRQNYKRCIGLTGFDSQYSNIQIFQNGSFSEEPTSYGINDFGKYFIPPYTLYGQYFYPLSRNSWANTSMWVKLGYLDNVESFENMCRTYYKEYWLKDTYHIADVIKAILSKIDPSIKHEKTAEYSQFLYGLSGATASALGGCAIYITQKTNVLKGNYDQAAQKAEITFKQIMEMLRDCFRCYWFIDEQNRFRIEHVSYFINGLSYDDPGIQIDLTSKKDKFNKKEILYSQQETSFDKSDLISRYEFKYMDDATKAMGGDLYIDVKNEYIQKDKKEEININSFSADIDYMLFKPEDFSSDGFALILANASNGRTPIVRKAITDEKQYGHKIDAYIQNWYASFNQLVWHYMEDLSGNSIDYNNVENLYVGKVKRCLKQNVQFPYSNIDVYKLIKTDTGNGCVEELDVNIDTNLTEVELRYSPV